MLNLINIVFQKGEIMKFVIKPLKKDMDFCLKKINETKGKIESIVGGEYKIEIRSRSIVLIINTEFQLNTLSDFLSSILPKETKIPYWG